MCSDARVDPAKDLTAVAYSHVRMRLRKLTDTSLVTRGAVTRGRLEIFGAVLNIENGAVESV